MRMRTLTTGYGLTLLAVIALFAVAAPQPVSVDAVAWQQAGNLFAILVVLALVAERAQEVVMTAWRAADSEYQKLEIARLKSVLAMAKVTSADAEHLLQLAGQLHQAEQRHLAYRAQTRVFALYLGLLLGVLISAAGFRLLQGLLPAMSVAVLPTTAGVFATTGVPGSGLPAWQIWLFNALDILLTGAVIAGGSDGVHKLAECYQSVLGKVMKNQGTSTQ